MAVDSQSFPVIFGPFEVHSVPPELRKGGTRIRLSGQPFRILLVLLAHPGDLVTREQLRDEIWGKGTFVEFDHGLNAAMNKLRRALSDSAETPRYIETLPGQGYRFVGMLERREPAPVPAADSVIRREPVGGRKLSIRWPAYIAACLTLSLAVWWALQKPKDTMPAWSLVRLTTEDGLADTPALSPDGKLVAYSSDRALNGQEDLYIKQVAGGRTIRLTFDGAQNTTPDFSPDGNRIVFHANRDGGGIYEIPSFGGEPSLLARDGLNPRFSPDGSQVAYWIGEDTVASAVPGSGAVWVVPAVAGGQPRRVGPGFTAARNPIWSPDGKHLLLVGYTSAAAFESSSLDWWLLDVNSGEAVKTGAHDALVHGGLRAWQLDGSGYNLPALRAPGCWSESGTVVFSAPSGDTHSLWEIRISPRTGKVDGVPERLTTGAGNETAPSCASGGAIAFSNSETRTDIWSQPFDLNGGTPRGALQRITQSPVVHREFASLSDNGRYVSFSSNQTGRSSIWMHDLATGQESHVADSLFAQRFPVTNTSGSRIAFSAYEKDKRVVYATRPEGAPEKLCNGCLRATDWSKDEKTLLVFGGSPYQIDVLDASTHSEVPLLKHPGQNLLYGRFSPDDSWVSFTARVAPNRARIMIAPTGGRKAIPESSWIKIAETGIEDWANWSPDGKTIYYTSSRDGHACLWGQGIDGVSRQPLGEPFAVAHFHERLTYRQAGGWSAAGGRIALMLSETTGNVWLMSHAGARIDKRNLFR